MSSRPAFRVPFRRVFLPALAAAAIVPSSAAAYPTHQVTPGETLSSIAAANGMQVARLAAANGLEWNAQVIAGQVLQVPPADGAYTSTDGQTKGYSTSSTPIPGSARAAREAAAGTSTSSTGTASSGSASSGSSSSGSSSSGGGAGHSVNPGDTLSAIAARLGVSIQALAAANGIANPNLIYSGTSLRAPAPGTTATPAPASVPATTPTAVSRTATTTSSATGPEGSAAYSGGGAGNSAERLSSSQIASIASQHGIPGNLAAAIAWQESGNNNALVSSTGARGVMQIMPGTWDWINKTQAAGNLKTHSATENVRAGSLLLKALLKETGGDEATAIAGYYQGLSSVRSRGMYDDTKQYVKNVQALKGRVGQ